MKLFDIVSLEQYQQRRHDSWPDYQAVINGVRAPDGQAQVEIDGLFAQGFQAYLDEQKSNDIAEGNRAAQRQTFHAKHVDAPPHQHCRNPWQTMGINSYGDVFICASPAWIPKFVGNIFCADDIFDILNSDTARQIRQEILSGRYFFCNLDLCDYPARAAMTYSSSPQDEQDLSVSALQDDPALFLEHVPRNLIFDFDHTCNYQCPSCRTGLINHNKHPIIRKFNDGIVQKIKTLVIDRIQARPVTIRWAGGEPFISAVYLKLIEHIISTKKTNIDHVLQTNGSYLRSKSALIQDLMPVTKELRISFDAATAETYSRVRKNGVWQNLIANVEWILEQRQINQWKVDIVADFVVQKDNYQEIPAFQKLCESLGIAKINWQKLWNWDTWPQSEFDTKNVHDSNHPEHLLMIEILAQVQSR